MTEQKTFSKKFNAQRAAKSAAAKGLHLEVVEVAPGKWALNTIDKPEPAKSAADAAGDEVSAMLTGRTAKPKASKVRAQPKASAEAKPARGGKRAAIEAAAQAGQMPEPPDFSADTHKPYRKKLAALVALAKAGNVKALRAYPIKPYSSSPKALDRYRNLCVTALEAKAQANA